MNTSRYIALSAAANELGVHPQTLRKWVDDGKVPAIIMPSGYRRFTREQLDEIMRGMGLLPKLIAA